MRRNQSSERFPNSAQLFRFCLKVMEANSSNKKVHDQELGNILGFNPSDTSHWKRGKKAVKSIYALEKLSKELKVSLDLVQELSSGTIEIDEAWFEFNETTQEVNALEKLTKRQQKKWEEVIPTIENAARMLLDEAEITTAPVFLPELLSVIPSITLTQVEMTDRLCRSFRTEPGHYTIRYLKSEMRPHIRASIAREVAKIALFTERERLNLGERDEDLEVLETNMLANALLVPSKVLFTETQRISPRNNAEKLLADVFWVPRFVVRSRLTQLFQIEPSQMGLSTGTENATSQTLN